MDVDELGVNYRWYWLGIALFRLVTRLSLSVNVRYEASRDPRCIHRYLCSAVLRIDTWIEKYWTLR